MKGASYLLLRHGVDVVQECLSMIDSQKAQLEELNRVNSKLAQANRLSIEALEKIAACYDSTLYSPLVDIASAALEEVKGEWNKRNVW